MNNPDHISAFLLERYHIGEVDSNEKLLVENALALNPALADTLAGLDRADLDFREKFPKERFFPTGKNVRRFRTPTLRHLSPVTWGLAAAALVMVIALPLFIVKNPANAAMGDRIKGSSGGNSAELSVYLKGAVEAEKLPDRAVVRAGNTVQLAYRIQEPPTEKYGVIFSIDGRSSVTMHYPYNLGQSGQLVSGRSVPLDEAYTLDDAPDYEIFFFVVADKPLEAKNILDTAQQLAPVIAKNPQGALRQGSAAFKGCELKTLTLRKEN